MTLCYGTVITPTAYLVLSMINDYNHLMVSTATPQYGFKKGLEIQGRWLQGKGQ